MKTIAFNTKREYTIKGQRVIARETEHGDVIFCDLDRGISGILPSVELKQSAIMRAYDTGDYNEYEPLPPEMNPYILDTEDYYNSIVNDRPFITARELTLAGYNSFNAEGTPVRALHELFPALLNYRLRTAFVSGWENARVDNLPPEPLVTNDNRWSCPLCSSQLEELDSGWRKCTSDCPYFDKGLEK